MHIYDLAHSMPNMSEIAGVYTVQCVWKIDQSFSSIFFKKKKKKEEEKLAGGVALLLVVRHSH